MRILGLSTPDGLFTALVLGVIVMQVLERWQQASQWKHIAKLEKHCFGHKIKNLER